MNILGLYDGHNANAALISDGRIAAAVEEERFSRVKNHDGRLPGMTSPKHSVEYCLSHLKGDLDAIAVALQKPEQLWRKAINNFVESIRRGNSDRIECRRVKDRVVDGCDLFEYPRVTQRERLDKIFRQLNDLEVDVGGIRHVYVPHHLAHLASAYFTGGMDEALLVSLDGKGDGLSGMAGIGRGGRIEVIDEIDYFHSIGHFYSIITVLCGFQPVRHEGKVTGLAAYSAPEPSLTDRFFELFPVDRAGRWQSRLNSGLQLGPYPHTKFGEMVERVRPLVEGYSRETIAASAQSFTEDRVTDYVKASIERTGVSHVFLCGGLFANVKINQRIAELSGVETTYIHPAMHDGGLGVGAALHAYYDGHPYKAYRINDVFLGPDYTDDQLESVLIREAIPHRRYSGEELDRRVAELLAEGKVVARFDGRLEYGPRALGNRSVLCRTTDPSVNDWLNKKLRRTEFMPFAPVTLEECFDDCYRNNRNSRHTAQFMTITYRCTQQMRSQSPAVVHIDGTARPQLVAERNHPRLFRILQHYKEITGIPSLINTSFNAHEEPIVCSPQDAMRSFCECGLDYMAFGPFLVARDGWNSTAV